MKLAFFGDINFRNQDEITPEASLSILAQVLPKIDDSDYRIANLETPLADRNLYSPIVKSGPNHIYSPSCLSFLQVLRCNIAVLANNHMGDFGDGALLDTVRLLEDNGIRPVGAGKNIYEAYRAVYMEKDGIRVSLLAVCENEFGLANEDRCGTAAYRPRLLLQKIKEEKQQSDFVIVVFHGGNEFNPLPSPGTVERYRMICDMGADAVIAGHPHCPQGYEFYQEKPIIYSLGNFMFQSGIERAESDSWYYGCFCTLEFSKGQAIHTAIQPYRFNRSAVITVPEGKEKEELLAYLARLSAIIQDREELHRHYMGWCYLHPWFPTVPEQYSGWKDQLASSLNMVQCEAHLEMLQENYRILHAGEEDLAKAYANRISALAILPQIIKEES